MYYRESFFLALINYGHLTHRIHNPVFSNACSAIFEKFEYPDSTTNERLIALRKYDNSVDFEVIINPKETYEVHALAKSKVFMNPDHERIIITVFLDISNMVMLKNLGNLMQKNFCSLFTFPVFGSGSVYTLFVENVGHL